ncbi:MAG TPA: hypothetical protein VKE40_11215 [Gemmataceae bacterium]|nr:hypothetical protein [Gemmataceae bacterium]
MGVEIDLSRALEVVCHPTECTVTITFADLAALEEAAAALVRAMPVQFALDEAAGRSAECDCRCASGMSGRGSRGGVN